MGHGGPVGEQQEVRQLDKATKQLYADERQAPMYVCDVWQGVKPLRLEGCVAKRQRKPQAIRIKHERKPQAIRIRHECRRVPCNVRQKRAYSVM